MFKRYILWAFFAILLSWHNPTKAQNAWINPILREGKPCPNFVLYDVEENDKKIVSLKSLLGKPFVLDFFSTGCTSCFASFADINKLNKEFASQVKIILVGRDDKYIRKAYLTFKKRQSLQIPHVFDIKTVNKFKIQSFPYVIWVDAKGIITAITSSADWTKENVAKHAMGNRFDHSNRDESLERYVSFDIHHPVSFDNSAWKDSLFYQRSLITAWKRSMGNAAQIKIENYAQLKIPLQIVGWPLISLFRLAYINRLTAWDYDDTLYYGNFHFAPVYELSDSSLFQFDWNQENNMFCYSQVLASGKDDTAKMLQIMRDDLYNTFGYTASVELREMPYLKLVKNDENYQDLKSQGGSSIEEVMIDGINFKNVTIQRLVSVIEYKSELVPRDLPLVDETGINYPIDITFKASMTDISDIIKEIPKHGLKIIPGTKMMKVLVIHDGNYADK